MELPAILRHAVDQALEGVPLGELIAAADRLSQRYRAEIRDGRFHLSDDLAALAYLTTRLPATYAAIRAALSMVTERLPDFRPDRQLDLGAGPGTAFWAALDCWPDLRSAHLLEGSAAIRRQGELLIERAVAAAGGDGVRADIRWQEADLARIDEAPVLRTMAQQSGAQQSGAHQSGAHQSSAHQADPQEKTNWPGTGPADLVTLCYVLDELSPEARHRLVDRAWANCTGLLLIVEPGTPAGWHRILAARDQLLGADARIVAPCPHALPCPLLPQAAPQPNSASPNGSSSGSESWCHFSRRVARSRLHRLAKQADVPWEDEKFIFIAVAQSSILGSVPQTASPPPAARIIAPVRGGSGRLQLQLCESNGQARDRLVTKRDGELYRRVRRLDWGDWLPI